MFLLFVVLTALIILLPINVGGMRVLTIFFDKSWTSKLETITNYDTKFKKCSKINQIAYLFQRVGIAISACLGLETESDM